MKLLTKAESLKETVKEWKAEGVSTGFVPTMGALHQGHLSMIREACANHDKVIVSIFVNPLQFGPLEDYDTYPSDLEGDAAKAEQAGADIIFAPAVHEMYPRELYTTIHVEKGVQVLCGRSRPGHFDGVATVLMKLFQIVDCDQAYFGQKDAQQAAVVQNMVIDFNLSTEIVTCKTIREEDGLAVSSRNAYLTDNERRQAPMLYRALQAARKEWESGKTEPALLEKTVKDQLAFAADAEIEYAEVLAYPELEPLPSRTGFIIIAAAIRFSSARLIDNVLLPVSMKQKEDISCTGL